MIFIDRSDLVRIRLTDERDRLSFGEIEEALREHFSDAVYVEADDRLYGMVTYGDLLRAQKTGSREVGINKRFRSVGRSDYIRAREVFKDSSRIHHLPVTDDDGRFLGVFSRYDDLLYLTYDNSWEHDRFAGRYFGIHERIQLVKPVNGGRTRRELYETWKKRLTGYGCQVRETGWEEIEERKDDLVLFTDEEEKRGTQIMRLFRELPFDGERFVTYCDLLRAMNEPPAELIYQDLKDRGVHVIMLTLRPGDSAYQKGIRQAFAERAGRYRGDVSYVHEEEAPAFYGDDYTAAYAAAVGRHLFLMEKQNSFTRLKDGDEPYFHVANGERLTVGQPEKAAHDIYFFGPCVAVGSHVEDGHTIESRLQEMLNGEGYAYRVINCGSWATVCAQLTRIASAPLKRGDTAVIFDYGHGYEGFEEVELWEVLEKNGVPACWLTDSPVHGNKAVNRLYAAAVMEKMKQAGYLEKDPEAPLFTRRLEPVVSPAAVRLLYTDRYFYGTEDGPSSGKTGNISMHANPFTLGHRYLIEYACRRMDKVIVLLIEEEMGIFSFAERYAMTCEALKDLDNVVIAPAGPFQANRAVFPGYFVKTEGSFEKDAENDSRIFGAMIAPALGIRYRFFGDEEHNPKMKRFNRIAAEVFGEYGIETIVVPRAKKNGAAISASAVRRMDAREAREMVPESTLKIMQGVSFD